MKFCFIVSLALLIGFTSSAQKSPVKFGDIPMEDMKMVSYPEDTTAEAVVLLNYGEASIEFRVNSLALVDKRHVRIKILKPGGLSHGDISIYLFRKGSTDENVRGLKANTYNLEGGKIVSSAVTKENIVKERVDDTRSIQKFTMPNAKVGSVIEYTYSVDSDYWSIFPNWEFQDDVPVRRSEFWAVIPSFITYQKYMNGYLAPMYELKQVMSGGEQVNAHHWTMEHVPAFKAEPYMTSETDYISRINFAISGYTTDGHYKEIMGSWEKLVKQLLESENFGMVISHSGFLKSKAEELTTGVTDPVKKAEAIHTWVKRNIEWDGTKDYETLSLRKVVDSKKGSSGDINLLLGSLLDKAGFDVKMVMLSTRDHGFLRQNFPMTRQFNYVICSVKVGEKTLLMDATESYLPMALLPERCLNGYGLLVTEPLSWIEIPAKAKGRTITTGDFILSETGELKGKLAFSRDGYSAHAMRRKYVIKGEEGYLKDFSKERNWKIEKSEFAEIKELDKSVKETHTVQIDEHASVAGDVIYINPFVDARLQDNPFKSETRTYPVDYGHPREEVYICKIALPEGFIPDELPKSKVAVLPGNAARFTYSATLMASTVNITCSIQINKVLFLQDEYPALREFYAQLISKQNEQIVLKKK